MKKFTILLIAGFSISNICFAQEMPSKAEQPSSVLGEDDAQPEKIIEIKKVKDKNNAIDPEKDKKMVDNAIQVYKNKQNDDGDETTWYIEKSDGSKTLIVGKAYSSADNTLVFSPDGNKAFYMGLSSGGTSMVYGLDLSTDQTYSFGGATSFGLADCPNKGSYVVLNRDGDEQGSYYIYDLDGNSIDKVTYTGDINDISDIICY